MRARLREHSRPSAWSNSATFAFILAMKQARILDLKYESITRATLRDDPVFDQIFTKAKIRVKAMGIRYVEITNQKEQALFEVYAAMELNTPHNTFENH